ncbi:AAA family ATPase [Tundrisphaera sp. TA3]|uniref:AAA family ATPase n=1 Tax=Tundrisphaera sp. TA3 TaxID=3435775 RepID=UPI003EB84DD5
MIRPDVDGQGRSAETREALVLPSRRAALNLIRDALESGPILLTGHAGAGKTWLRQRLAAEAGPGRSWAEVDLTPADDPASFLGMVGHAIGVPGRTRSRLDIAEFLAERSADGERSILAIEEAHNLSPAVAEEVRVLANRLGRADGFAGLMLIGQTSLALRMSTRVLASIEARLSARVHLGPIDADEARELLAWHRPDLQRSIDDVERAHRDAGGNPRRMLRMAPAIGSSAPAFRPGSLAVAPPKPTPQIAAPPPAPPARRSPMTGPDRPPLRVEDELIEVGWSPEDPVASDPAEQAAIPAEDRAPSQVGAGIASGEEAVHDHYAALQAWREWADNQTQRALSEPIRHPIPGPPADDEDVDPDPDPDAATPYVRVDGRRDFAPFGQLFSHMSRAQGAE